MNSINKFFDKVFVTTIDSHQNRKDSLKARILGIEFEYFNAIDLTKEEYKQFKYVKDFPDKFFRDLNLDRHYSSRWTKGQLGCFANLIKLYQKILERNYNCVLILEDDVIFKSNVFKVFDSACLELPPDWDIVLFGFKRGFDRRFMRGLKKIYYFLRNKNYRDYIPLVYSNHIDVPPYKFTGAFAYGISKHGIMKVLAYNNEIQEFGDILFPTLARDPRFKVFSIYPHIAEEAGFISSTQQNW